MMSVLLQFRWCSFDSATFPFPSSVTFFTDNSSSISADRVTTKSEADAITWLLMTPIARDLLFREIDVPSEAYVQATIIEPLLERNPMKKPGDIDLILIPSPHQPHKPISVQAKRIKVQALGTYRDEVSNRQLRNLSDLIEQGNGSRDLGFHLNYVLVIVETDGAGRSEFNHLARNATNGTFNRIYGRVLDGRLHPDIGVIFVEISQPTQASIDQSGSVAVCVDRRATPLDQPSRMTAKLRRLMAEMPSL